MSSLSVAMIVKNEEHAIGKCLDSVRTVADEIIIVDTGSTDQTKDVALQYTNKVYDFTWINDFSAARNFSFFLCTKEWILWIDADDEIGQKDQEKIRNLDYTDREIIICPYHYSHDEFGVTECILERERFIKRSLDLKWQKPIHEYLPIKGKKVSREDIIIHHHKKHSSSQRNVEILEKITETDKDPRNFFYFGKELMDFGRVKEGIENLEKFVTTNGWWEDVFLAYHIISKGYRFLKQEDKFFENIFKSITIEPRRAEPFYDLGDYYFNKKDWGKAIFWFEQCIDIKRPIHLMSTYYPQYYTWKPALALCLCYNNSGNVQKAYEYNELFLKYRPNDLRGHHNRAILKNSPLRIVRKDGEKRKLNLGCGNKRLEGYINADIMKIDGVDEVFPLYEIPYRDNTISEISTEHALEHVSLECAKQAIQEWFRVLEPGGKLNLYIPDLELCCEGYLEGNNDRKINGFPEKEWFKYTLYGYQKNANGSVAEHQFHLSGFSKEEVKQLLESVGFIINSLENY